MVYTKRRQERGDRNTEYHMGEKKRNKCQNGRSKNTVINHYSKC